jgi:hypothetical protein
MMTGADINKHMQTQAYGCAHTLYNKKHILKKKNIERKRGKVIPVTSRGGPLGCETSRIPHFLNNWLIDSG